MGDGELVLSADGCWRGGSPSGPGAARSTASAGGSGTSTSMRFVADGGDAATGTTLVTAYMSGDGDGGTTLPWTKPGPRRSVPWRSNPAHPLASDREVRESATVVPYDRRRSTWEPPTRSRRLMRARTDSPSIGGHQMHPARTGTEDLTYDVFVTDPPLQGNGVLPNGEPKGGSPVPSVPGHPADGGHGGDGAGQSPHGRRTRSRHRRGRPLGLRTARA